MYTVGYVKSVGQWLVELLRRRRPIRVRVVEMMAGSRRGVRVRRVDEPPYTVDWSLVERYDQVNLIFNRVGNDPGWGGYLRDEEEAGLRNIREAKPGYDRVDYALAEAAWTVHDVWTRRSAGTGWSAPAAPASWGTRGKGRATRWTTCQR